MLCCAVLSDAVLCYAVLCCAMPCCAMLCCAVLCYAVLQCKPYSCTKCTKLSRNYTIIVQNAYNAHPQRRVIAKDWRVSAAHPQSRVFAKAWRVSAKALCGVGGEQKRGSSSVLASTVKS